MTDVARFLTKVSRKSALGEFLAADGPRYVPAFAKVSNKDEGFVTRLWGIPIGFQFATGLGMQGHWADVLDIITDPLILGPSLLKAPASLLRAGRTGGAGRALFGSTRAARMAKMGPAVERMMGDGWAKNQTLEALARGVETTGRLDVSSYRKYQQIVRGSTDDNLMTNLLKAQKAEQAEVSAALLTTRPKEAILSDIAEIQGRIDKLKVGGKKSAPHRIDELEKKKVLLRDDLEVPFLPGREVESKFINTQLEDVIIAANNGGKVGAEATINAAMRNRSQVWKLAKEMRKAPTASGLVQLEKKLLTLDRSPRTMAWFRDNKKALNELVTDVYAGRGIPAPLVRGTLGDQAAAGQRALLSAKIPFTGIEIPLIKGEGALNKIDDVLRKIRGTKEGKPLVLGAKRSAGLVQGAKLATLARRRDLGLAPAEVSSATVFKAAENAVESIGPVFDDFTPFENIAHAQNIEQQRAFWSSSALGNEVSNFMLKNKMDPAADGLRLQRLLSDPDKFLVGGGQKVEGKFGGMVFGGELTKAARAEGFTESHLELSQAIAGALQDAGTMLEREGMLESFVGTYFPRRYKILKDRNKVRNRLKFISKGKKNSTFFKHGQPRLIQHFDEVLKLEKEGFVEIEKDIGKVLQAYFHEAGRATANKRFLQRTVDSKVMPNAGEHLGEKAMGLATDHGGIPILLRPDSKIAAIFGESEYTAFRQRELVDLADAISIERAKLGHKTKLVKDGEVMIHNSVARQLSTLLVDDTSGLKGFLPFSEEAFEAAIRVNATAKRGLLLWSMFHHMALTESGLATLGTDYVRMFRHLNPAKAAAVSLGKGKVPSMLDAADLVDTASRHGVKLGAISDVEVDVFQKTMAGIGKKLPIVSPATRAVGQFEMKWNKGLWDFYHNSMKLFAFDTIYQRALVRHGDKPAKVIAKGVAEHINNAFGGQMWENFWVSKRGQKWLRLMLMAPDWTFSNMRVAADVFANQIKKNELGQKLMSMGGRFPVSAEGLMKADIRATYARQYALRTGLIFGVYANFANFAFTGHYMDENPEGQRARIQLPWTDDKGRGQFLRFGKQFREPFDAFLNPTDFIKRKQAFFPNVWSAVVWNRDFFGRPVASIEDGAAISALKKTGWIAKNFVPIPLQEAFGVGKPEARPLRGAFGFVGLPVKTAPNKLEQGEIEALFQGDELQIPEVFGDLADELRGSGDFSQLQDELLALPQGLPPGF